MQEAGVDADAARQAREEGREQREERRAHEDERARQRGREAANTWHVLRQDDGRPEQDRDDRKAERGKKR